MIPGSIRPVGAGLTDTAGMILGIRPITPGGMAGVVLGMILGSTAAGTIPGIMVAGMDIMAGEVTHIGEAIVTIGVATILIMEVCTPELAVPTERAHGAVR